MKLIKTDMTPKERLTCYAAGEEVDRIPVIMTSGETAPPMYGMKIRDYYFSQDVMFEIECNLARDFGSDNMGIRIGLRAVAEALGTKLKYPDDGLSYVHKPVITDIAQIDSMNLVDIEKDGALPVITSTNAKLQEKFGATHFITCSMAGPITTAASLYGVDRFLRDTVRNPEGIHRLMRYATDNIIKCVRDTHKKIGIGFSISEPLITTDVMSPKQFSEFANPYTKEVMSAITGILGKKPSVHICGHTKKYWPQIMAWDISSFSVDNCESLLELKNKHGGQLTIVGNIPPVDILLNGTPASVEEAVRKCLLEGSDSTMGFIL